MLISAFVRLTLLRKNRLFRLSQFKAPTIGKVATSILVIDHPEKNTGAMRGCTMQPPAPTLAELGIEKMQSARAQKLAKVPPGEPTGNSQVQGGVIYRVSLTPAQPENSGL